MLSNRPDDSCIIPDYPGWVLATGIPDQACLYLHGSLASLFQVTCPKKGSKPVSSSEREVYTGTDYPTMVCPIMQDLCFKN